MIWQDFKKVVETSNLSIQLKRNSNKKYVLFTYNGPRMISCVILKSDPKNEDQIDFENNFLEYVDGDLNTRPVTVDSDIQNLPFASKTMPDGRKIFRRTHGISGIVAGSPDSIVFNVPYANCKITGIEIINGDIGDSINLKVLDTPSGTISTIPDYMLNQFGFSTYISGGFHKYESNYDADLIENMKILIEYDAINSNLLPKTVYINIILHEIV